MKTILIPLLSVSLFAMINSHCGSSASLSSRGEDYQCLPCGNECDKKSFTAPGKCPDCQMDLVKKSTVNFGTIEPADICKYISEHPDVVLLDVRTKEEFEGKSNPALGTLKNAINLPIQSLAENLSTLEQYKNKEIIVYCARSHRSPRAAYLLTQNGFTKVINMAGGMSAVKDSSCLK